MNTRHTPTECKRVSGVELRYSFKNWSDRFECSECGKGRRFSLNFLGQRKPVCDGLAIKTEKPAPAKVVSWKDDARRFAVGAS
jgi:hypothetical protein